MVTYVSSATPDEIAAFTSRMWIALEEGDLMFVSVL